MTDGIRRELTFTTWLKFDNSVSGKTGRTTRILGCTNIGLNVWFALSVTISSTNILNVCVSNNSNANGIASTILSFPTSQPITGTNVFIALRYRQETTTVAVLNVYCKYGGSGTLTSLNVGNTSGLSIFSIQTGSFPLLYTFGGTMKDTYDNQDTAFLGTLYDPVIFSANIGETAINQVAGLNPGLGSLKTGLAGDLTSYVLHRPDQSQCTSVGYNSAKY